MGGATTKTYTAPAQVQAPAISPVTNGETFDLNKFAGSQSDHWYEIARIKNNFQSECNKVVHTVRLTPEGPILYSSCYSDTIVNGEYQLTTYQKGRLWTPNPNDKSKMQVTYDNWFGARPIDFWVYDTDYTTFAVVGNQAGLVWILSRKSTMSTCEFVRIVKAMMKKGFSFEKEQFYVKFRYLEDC
jgi:lipocalin